MNVIEPQGANPSKLPLWDTICLSYSTYFNNFLDVLRISWLWMLVGVPLLGYASWQQMSWMAKSIDLKPGIPPPPVPTQTLLLGLAGNLVLMLAGLSIAVAWHRRLILHERAIMSGANIVSASVWRYVGVGLAIGLIGFAPVLVVVVPALFFLGLLPVAGGPATPPSGFEWMMLPLFLVYLAAFAVMLRLILLLPARAVGDLGLTFKETWHRTRGNTWRIFWGLMATSVPLMFAGQIVALAFVGFPGPGKGAMAEYIGRMAFLQPIFIAYYLLLLPIGIGFMSHAYQHFFRRP